jgi:hypothetical protein
MVGKYQDVGGHYGQGHNGIGIIAKVLRLQ